MDSIDTILKELHSFLQEKVKQYTQMGLSKQTGCPQSRINDYFKHEEKLQTATLFNILRLFPELQRPILQVLEGHGVGPVHQEANGNTNSHINQTTGVVSGDGEALRAKIVLSILDLDLSPEVQSQILKVVKNA